MDFATKKKHYINEIQNIAKESFNEEQKKLAYDILNTATENNIDSLYTFITQRVKIGFVFDAAPEVAHNCISLCERDDKKSFGSPADNAVHHKLIIGENYDALKNLVATYTKNGHGMIDVIYIDPPYNTEQMKEDGDDYKTEVISKKFMYRDKFSRTGWLNLMNERLKFAKKLLSEKGVIFISIDDSEQAYLKVLCDEIFGEGNFVCNVPRITKKGGKSTNTIQNNHDYLMCYTTSTDIIFSQLEKSDLSKYKYSDEFLDTRGKYALTQTLDYNSLQYSEGMDFAIKLNGQIFIPGSDEEKHRARLAGHHGTTDWVWRWSKQAVEWGIKEKAFEIKNNRIYTKSYLNVRKKNGVCAWEEIEQTKPYTTLSYTENAFSNDNATKELDKIGVKFSNPKPSAFIKELIKMINSDKNSIILDFFAGSGTTGQAVMELNAEDGGSRQCILVTNNENNIATDVTYERLYRIVNGKGTKGESFKWTYKVGKPYLTNNYIDVFNVKSYELKIDDYEKSQKLIDKAKSEFKKLNPDYEAREFDIYNQLASLKPYKKDEVK